MIWFLKLLLRSLCGRTIELSMMTSDGIFTLQPEEKVTITFEKMCTESVLVPHIYLNAEFT